ncbi:MAG: DUF1080 domain-containing protein [Planctomycetes bacterium]|nr:DUF1080 domain-containing protein [Planctomycetota bacterium]
MHRSRSLAAVLALSPVLFAQEPADVAAPKPAPIAVPTPWRSLFDGKSLEGWTTSGGRYDGTARWTVEDGAIVGRVGDKQSGGLLYTTQAWHSFDFKARTRIDWPFDSGVFVRMAKSGKGAQITLDWREGGEVGGVYADGWLQNNPVGATKFRKDEWNDIRVRCTGREFRLEFWLNGEKLTDYRLPPGSEGYAASGLIGVQVHGGLEPEGHTARFSEIGLRELPVFDHAEFECDEDGYLSAREGRGWTSLIDAELSRFEAHGGDGKGFATDGREIAFLSEGGAHELRTREDWQDFVLRLDFAMVRGANSGVFLRADRARDDSAYSGCEIQILDDFHWEADSKSTLKPWQFTGSLYGAVPAAHPGTLYPHGCWNSYEIRCQGSRMRCELNGVTLWDVDTKTLKPEQGAPFAERAASGFIGLQRHAPSRAIEGGVFLRVRNAFVKKL